MTKDTQDEIFDFLKDTKATQIGKEFKKSVAAKRAVEPEIEQEADEIVVTAPVPPQKKMRAEEPAASTSKAAASASSVSPKRTAKEKGKARAEVIEETDEEQEKEPEIVPFEMVSERGEPLNPIFHPSPLIYYLERHLRLFKGYLEGALHAQLPPRAPQDIFDGLTPIMLAQIAQTEAFRRQADGIELGPFDQFIQRAPNPVTQHLNPNALFTIKPPRTKMQWTAEETTYLEEGMKRCGTNWAGIEALYGENGTINQSLTRRTQVSMKDKARNEKRRRIREGLPLGPFAMATEYSNN